MKDMLLFRYMSRVYQRLRIVKGFIYEVMFNDNKQSKSSLSI